MTQQISLMSRKWPGFKVCESTDWSVLWRGQLSPFCKKYLVEVSYRFGFVSDPFQIQLTRPQVLVLSPLLERCPENPEEPIPHHYHNLNDPAHPVLCLYDPVKKEWKAGDYIADKILPWTVNWLACYEGWQATGKWTGGGNH